MTAAFIFDTVIIKKESNYYGMTLNYEFFKNRYLTLYDSITVSTRVKNSDKVKGTEGYKKLNGENVKFIPINSYKSIPDALKNKRKICMELKSVIDSVDIVIIRMPSILGAIATDICRKNNKKYVIEMVACAWDGYMNHRNIFGKVIAPFIYIKTKKCVKKAPNVIYVTERFLQKRYPTDGRNCACSDVILNPIDDRILKERIEKIEKSYIKKMKMCTVANVGMKYKGHIYAFKAIKKLKECGYDIKYYLIGNGDTSYLKSIARKLNILDNVIFTGSLAHDDVFKKLQEMDIYVQPSLQEGLPRALVEAMSLGLPAIGSDAGGIPELLNKNMIFKKRNTNELIEIIKSLNNENMKNESISNYNRAKYFSKDYLEGIRKPFYRNI